MKKFLKYLIFFSIPVIVAMGILFLIPVDKGFSYKFVQGECENKASWIYSRIFENEKEVDIAFSGASQTGCAIMDELVENEINKQSVEPINVINMGYCRRGRDLQYVMLKDLFKLKKPKILVIEVPEDEPKKSHPIFPYLAETPDLWSSFIFFNQRFPSTIWKGLSIRFEYFKSILFKTKSDTPLVHNNYGYLGSTQTVSPDEIKQNAASWQKRLSRPQPEIIRKIDLNYSRHYLRKIVDLAKENNCKVLFIYLPESGSGLQLPLLVDYYQELADLIILPDTISQNRLNWKDATHFNDLGATETSKFISSLLKECN